MQVHTELTDTFGGEANYSWVWRYTFTLPDTASNKRIMRRAKAAVSLDGVRGRWEDHGDLMMFRPYGRCIVLFVTFGEVV